MSNLRILQGDVRQRLADLPSNSIHCCVTSPPYFGLRDYGMAAQIGLEKTPDAYVAEMVAVMREVRRVLRPDGTLWLNLGDSYVSAGGSGAQGATGQRADRTFTARNTSNKDGAGLAAKQRLMIPARVALALQSDGWWLRDEIIWHKPNPMPISVTDRTTPAHEMLYMFSKSARYYYDMEAVKEPGVTPAGTKGAKGSAERAAMKGVNSRPPEYKIYDGMRQPRSVWSIATKPFKGAHFATFPPDLIRPCILAGCPPRGTVLDPFSGSGTTLDVARSLGRNGIGVELNPEYVSISVGRILSGAAA